MKKPPDLSWPDTVALWVAAALAVLVLSVTFIWAVAERL